jgi:hypothetical protein
MSNRLHAFTFESCDAAALSNAQPLVPLRGLVLWTRYGGAMAVRSKTSATAFGSTSELRRLQSHNSGQTAARMGRAKLG